jgi:hypothetical protein
MFIRVKSSPNSKGRSVQIVQSQRKGDKITQRIVRHVGMGYDDEEIAALKLLAASIKDKLEQGGQQFLFKPEEITKLGPSKSKYGHEDYIVDLHDLLRSKDLSVAFMRYTEPSTIRWDTLKSSQCFQGHGLLYLKRYRHCKNC